MLSPSPKKSDGEACTHASSAAGSIKDTVRVMLMVFCVWLFSGGVINVSLGL